MYADGRLDHVEFDTRLELALKARTRAELNSTFDGLVSRPVPTYAPAAFTRPAPLQRYDSEGRGMGTIAHWLGYPTFFVGPAIVVATAGQKNPAVRKHAVEALNFQLSAFGAFALLGIVTGVTARVPGLPVPAARHPLVRPHRYRRPRHRGRLELPLPVHAAPDQVAASLTLAAWLFLSGRAGRSPGSWG